MSVTKNTKQIESLTNSINQMKNRVNELVDRLAMMSNELQRFKENVASDVKYLTERVDG